MRAIVDRSDELVIWAAQRIEWMHGRAFPDGARAIGVEVAGEIGGAVVFHDWQPEYRTIQVSFAAADPRWMLARRAFGGMFDYAFNGCGVDKIWSLTPTTNERALRAVIGLGFKPEAVLERQFGDVDAVMSRRFRWEYYAQ